MLLGDWFIARRMRLFLDMKSDFSKFELDLRSRNIYIDFETTPLRYQQLLIPNCAVSVAIELAGCLPWASMLIAGS
jgi:hypothetical protein